MPQEQRQIPVKHSNGEQKIAIATGNNAAWHCVCERTLPLLGCAGSVKGATDKTRIECPDCGRCYFVEPDGYDRAKAREVIEVTFVRQPHAGQRKLR